MAVDEKARTYSHPLYDMIVPVPGGAIATTQIDKLLTWGLTNSLWIFPMATSCCGIEFMATAAARVDIDRMGTIVRGTPRQADVMVVAGTITIKMAPRVKKLWDQMPEPKWALAMGSCAISGDFYRDLYPTVPGIDTFLPVDVYVPGCPPNPEALMDGMMRLQEKVRLMREGKWAPKEARPETAKMILPKYARVGDPARDPKLDDEQVAAVKRMRSLLEAPMPLLPELQRDAPDREVEKLLREEFGVTEIPANAAPLVDAQKHGALARALVGLGFSQFVYVVASHWPEVKKKDGSVEPEHFEVAYSVRKPGRVLSGPDQAPGSRLAQWRVRLEPNEEIDSLCEVLAGADWQEREQFDMIGVRFRGHPDLRRLLMPPEYEGFPLRKDHAADAPWAPWR
jgi:NADH-quinone oxidoreductase subunit B/C/D